MKQDDRTPAARRRSKPMPVTPARELPVTQIDRPDPLSVEVARQLLGYFLSGNIELGTRLPSERELASRFGVGRSAIRDALRPLALLGVIEVRPGSGTYLKASSSDLLPEVIEWGLLLGERSLDELIEARGLVEAGLARLAAMRRDDVQVEELRAAIDRMEGTTDIGVFVEADLAFHLGIAEAARNEVLGGVVKSIRTLLAVWIRRVLEYQDAASVRAEHRAILDAIERGDADGAAAAMERHMIDVTGALRASLGGAPPAR